MKTLIATTPRRRQARSDILKTHRFDRVPRVRVIVDPADSVQTPLYSRQKATLRP
ncbi:MAG: hypothetical protein WBP81_38955 [Solirubrobacteraceae bacterium]